MHEESVDRVRLDRSGDVWEGTFPGVGSVRVWPDGRFEVDVTSSRDSEESHDHLHDALTFGWAEPLSLVRRGFLLVEGIAVSDPSTDRGLLVVGNMHDTAIVTLALASLGWRVLADRIVPVTFDDDGIRAHPRTAPMLATKRRTDLSGHSGHLVRAETTAVAVDVERLERPCTVVAAVSAQVLRPDQALFDLITGHARFDIARDTLAKGVLMPPETTAQESMARTLRLASLPFAVVRLDRSVAIPNLDEMITWWEAL